MKGFMEFVREQGVVGLAVGFVLGAAVAKVVTNLVNDIINPFVGLAMGSAAGLEQASVNVGGAVVMYGHFLSGLIDFLIVALVLYYGVKLLRLDKLDKKKA